MNGSVGDRGNRAKDGLQRIRGLDATMLLPRPYEQQVGRSTTTSRCGA
jgi:hypothetical protein